MCCITQNPSHFGYRSALTFSSILKQNKLEHLVYVRAFLTHCLCSSGVENLVYVRAFLTPCLRSSLFDTMFTFERSRELFVRQAESRTPFRIVTLRTISYLNNECHFYISKALLTYPSSDRLRLAFLLCSIF